MPPKKSAPNAQAGYKTIAEYYGKEEYYKRFFKLLNNVLLKYYGKSDTTKILREVGKGSIKILNAELFFYTPDALYEPSYKPFTTGTNLTTFFCGTLLNCNRLASNGVNPVKLTWFLIHISLILSYTRVRRCIKAQEIIFPQLQALMDTFISALCSHGDKSHFTIRIVDKNIFNKMCDSIDAYYKSFECYEQVLNAFFDSYDRVKDSYVKIYRPQIEVVMSLSKDVRHNQENYLASVFGVSSADISKITTHVTSFAQDSVELDTALERIKSKSKYSFIELEQIKEELKKLENKPWKGYNKLNPPCNGFKLGKDSIRTHKINYIYIPTEYSEEFAAPALAEIEIPCRQLKVESIYTKLDMAIKLCLVKYRMQENSIKFNPTRNIKGCLRIILKELSPLTDEMIQYVKEAQGKLESLYNRKVNVVMEFDERVCIRKTASSEPTHIRVISDIHADINQEMGYLFDFGNDFVINCGDTSGDSAHTTGWIKSNMKQGLFTTGNHLGYSQPFPEKNTSEIHLSNTIDGQVAYLSNEFADSDVKYLNNKCVQYQNLYFVGCPLYTDFNLYGEEVRDKAMLYAHNGMNDYRYPKVVVNESDNKVGKSFKRTKIASATPEYFAQLHQESMNFLTETVRKVQGHSVIIFTHHAPLPYSISPEYANSPLNPAFANNLERFFEKFSNIRLWCHGHVHSQFDYIYVRKCLDGTVAETRVVCNPFGYYNENEVNPKKYGTRISLSDLRGTMKWTDLLADKIKKGKVKVYRKDY